MAPNDNLTLVDEYVKCTGASLVFTSLIVDPTLKDEQGGAKNTVEFDAFLTDFSETFASNWNTEEVFGRMDPIASFRNTRRTISLAWDIPAHNADEAIKNLDKIRNLTKMLYPAYDATIATATGPAISTSSAVATKQQQEIFSAPTLSTVAHTQTLSKPPLIKIKYSNLLRHDTLGGQMGWIDNFMFKPVLEMGYFFKDEKGAKNMYPKVINVSCNFNVLHQQNLGHTTSGQWIGLPNFPF